MHLQLGPHLHSGERFPFPHWQFVPQPQVCPQLHLAEHVHPSPARHPQFDSGVHRQFLHGHWLRVGSADKLKVIVQRQKKSVDKSLTEILQKKMFDQLYQGWSLLKTV